MGDARELGAGVAAPEESRSFRARCKGKERAEGGEEGTHVNGVSGVDQDAEAGKATWARCGCWPNAVVRPVICRGTRRRKKKGEGGGGHGIGKGKRHREGCVESTTATEDVDEPPPSSTDESDSHSHFHTDTDFEGTDADQDPDETTLSFTLFALCDLRADEEIVLGWEWDDGHAVHILPALMESPGMFGCVSCVSQADLMAHLGPVMVIACRLRITKEIEPHIFTTFVPSSQPSFTPLVHGYPRARCVSEHLMTYAFHCTTPGGRVVIE